MVKKQKAQYEATHNMTLVVGVALCIVSIIPLFIGGALDEEGMLPVLGLDLCLILVALGVFLLVKTCMVFGSYQRLLEEGDYSRQNKAEEKSSDAIDTIYWSVVTAVYLGWSFYTMEWHRTWIIWPCAAVFFGAVRGILSLIRRV